MACGLIGWQLGRQPGVHGPLELAAKLSVAMVLSAPVPLPAPGVPDRLVIPALHIDAPIVPAGLTADGEMQAPVGVDGTTWYQGGSRPGQPGNAVVAGHLTLGGSPGVFSQLRQLRPGDDVQTIDGQRIRYHFIVRSLQDYRPQAAPLNQIFGTSLASHLNLITCDGVWQPRAGQFSQRLVVFADLTARVPQR
ncbi:MAG TPA: class F sortase [Candidatus Saccharimonadia bacterium]|nr:class F sortase [Candidatus Saccharimonadia bacterium]